jgi:hypothetical protein
MNDIGSAIKECEYYLFADDALLSSWGTSVQYFTEKLNRDLKNLSNWLKFNKLKLNARKTKYIIMTGRRSNIKNGSTSLIIDGEQIATVTSDNHEIFGVLRSTKNLISSSTSTQQ